MTAPSRSLTVTDRTGAVLEAARRLDRAGVRVDDIAVRRPTLDDVFLSLTGHAAEENGSGEGDERERDAA